MIVRRPIQLVLGTALVLAGCNALLDIKDITLDPNAGGEGGPEASSESSTSDSPFGSEGGAEGGTCTGDLMVDKLNCGRCGHDCLGGDCTDGKCQLIALAGSLGAPEMLALDATNIYIANKRDDTVVRVSKTGGTVVTVVAAWKNVSSVAVAGTTLFWSSDGTLGDAGPSGNFGGVWKCTLPACTDKKLISTMGDVRGVDVNNGWAYYATFDQVRRVKDDGTGDMLIVAVNKPFSVRADATHVYYTSAENSLGRAPIGGGPEEFIGPQTGDFIGFLSLTSTRFFWAYSDIAGKGQAFGGLKAAPATRVSYGNMNLGSTAVTSDEKNAFWANDGTNTSGQSNGDGEILTCPVAGCGSAEPVRLADKLHYTGPMVVDGNALYFLEFGGLTGSNGRVLKIALP